jgi:hypothetical protein
MIVVSHDDATKAHDLSTQIKHKPGDDILLNMNAAQVTAYLALQDEVKKLRKNRSDRKKKSKRSNRKSEDDMTSEDESERPKKKFTPRPDLYCWCHGTQKTHSSPECKVMVADTDEFTPAMRKSIKSTSPPGGSTKMYGRKEKSSGDESHTEAPTHPHTSDRKFDYYKSDNNGKVYAIHDDLSTTDDNNHHIPGPAIAQTPDNHFRHDLDNDHNISYDIAD